MSSSGATFTDAVLVARGRFIGAATARTRISRIASLETCTVLSLRLRLAVRAPDRRRSGMRVARRPAPGLHLVQEILEQAVEERGLLEIDRVPALRQDREPRFRDAALHEQAHFEARLLFVSCQDERRGRDPLHLLGQRIERWPARLVPEHRIGRAQLRMLRELARVEREAARILVLQLDARRT